MPSRCASKCNDARRIKVAIKVCCLRQAAGGEAPTLPATNLRQGPAAWPHRRTPRTPDCAQSVCWSTPWPCASSSSRRPASVSPTPAQQLERFGRLHGADNADQRREHAHGRALHFLELLVRRKQAGVARRIGTGRGSNTPTWPSKRIAAPDTSGTPVRHAGAIDGVAGGEIVAAVEHHVGAGAPRPAGARPPAARPARRPRRRD